jgi:glucose dehydrogenase
MYNMGPDNEVGIGPRFAPHYPDDQAGSLATWFGDSWRHGGGTVWGYFTADLERNMFYYSSGNCGPWNPDYRREWGVVTLDENGGLIDYRNNWCASMLARDATTGELIWAFNHTPADMWDLDEPIMNPLIEIEIDGAMTEVVVRAARNGYYYVWDRDDGEMLLEPWPFVYVDWSHGYNMETGRAIMDITRWSFTDREDRERYTDYQVPGAETRDDYTGTEIAWCPGISARNWQNDAYNPELGLHYTPVNMGCATQVVTEGEYVAGEGYTLRRGAGGYPGGGARNPDRNSPDFGQPVQNWSGMLRAHNPATSSVAWAINWSPNNNVPIFATAGGLVFQGGSNEGEMRAFDAATGDELWAFRIGSQTNQSAVSYIGPDGRQYLAIIASGANTGQVNFDDGVNDADRYRRAGTTLFVFALPQAVAGGM